MFLLRFILIFILVVTVLRLLGRIFFASVIRSVNTRMTNDFSTNNRKEGDIKVDLKNTPKDKKINKDVGDYVNYEEVD